ncbi:MAG TPA: hydroxymethylpyrimidine/phosphomethylpyrimidine kinase [Pyrinomonadaceae bacterium]|jgi:hydroxymethylpyrimidine kinase/phosphomethylpyrimidine kinase
MTKVALTIAGLDPSGGAGIIADIKTFTAFGCFATAAVASLTFQNTVGVFGAVNQTAESLRGQVEPILQDFTVSALKTGMLPTREIIDEVARLVRENNLEKFVVDPVVRSTSGFDLIDDEALQALIEKLFPLSTVVTPNIPEAERIARIKIENINDIRRAAQIMQNFGARAVLIKGGHLPIADRGTPNAEYKSQVEKSTNEDPNPKTGDQKTEQRTTNDERRKAVDFMFIGEQEFTFSADFIETTATHGTGCTFAAAITANLANGKTLPEAVETAKRFVTEAIRTAPNLGRGHSPVNHSIANFDLENAD